jgi:hypothetical protein
MEGKYQPIYLPHFQKQLKQHIKKYKYLKERLIETLEYFNPQQHTRLGKHIQGQITKQGSA